MFSLMSLLFLEIVFLEFFSVIKSLLFPLNCVRRNHSKRYSFDKIFWKKFLISFMYIEAVVQKSCLTTATLLKRDSGTGAFLWILQNF